MKGSYFEEKGAELLEELGITKSEFARRMGIKRQNVNVLFKTNNVEIIARAAGVLGVPLALLVGLVDEPNVDDVPFDALLENVVCDGMDCVGPEDVQMGDSPEDRRSRARLIKQFYCQWLQNHEDKRVFNKSLNDYIYVKYISINETAGHASLRYLSTLAVLQLDSILPNAILKDSKPVDQRKKNQKGFRRMLMMEYLCPGIGLVRLTVGIKGSDNSKVQYCITAISAE